MDVVAIVRRLTLHQYQALALFLNVLTGDQRNLLGTSQDSHTDKAEKPTQIK
jgi:hypothetical protein